MVENASKTSAFPVAQPGKGAALVPRVAILFFRFGPYHLARLNAAAQVMSVWGIEACLSDDIYAWDKVAGSNDFRRLTLTDRNSDDPKWKQELRRKIRVALDAIKPHAVVIPGWIFPDALSALEWCAETKTPAVVMSESTAWDEARVFWKEWIKGRLVKMCAAALAGGTAHAEYLAQLGMAKGRIFLGYDVVDNDYFAAHAAEIRNQRSVISGLGSPVSDLPSSPFFLASARFIGKKNLPRLINAYARYRDLARKSGLGNGESKIWELVLLGDGPLRSSLCGLRSSLGLEACIHLPGFKQYGELPGYFGLAGAFVHVSTTEPWGLVVNEAMASGLPVLVSNRCGCAQDLVQEGVNGFSFDPRNVEELGQRMFELSAFPRSKLSAWGSESRRIISAWGPQRFASGLQAAVAASTKAGPPSFHVLDRKILKLLLRRPR
jgi:glycosyltransferase involved in cell wall biosynthesis